MRKLLSMSVCIALTVAAGAKPALAVDGPGIPNMTFQTTDLWKEISVFGAANFGGGPTGSNVAIMLHGYLVTLATNDSGVAPGVFHTFNVSNPRLPTQVVSYNGAGTTIMREQHAMPMAMVGGRDLLAAPTISGIQIWDVTDPTAIRLVSALTLAGAQGGDYDNAVWMLTWTWPYLFAGGTQNGVYIIDTRNPAQPTLLNRIPIQMMGNFRVGSVYAMGNELVAMTHEAECDQTALNCANPATINQISVLDVGDPTAPHAPHHVKGALRLLLRARARRPDLSRRRFRPGGRDVVESNANHDVVSEVVRHLSHQRRWRLCGQGRLYLLPGWFHILRAVRGGLHQAGCSRRGE